MTTMQRARLIGQVIRFYKITGYFFYFTILINAIDLVIRFPDTRLAVGELVVFAIVREGARWYASKLIKIQDRKIRGHYE